MYKWCVLRGKIFNESITKMYKVILMFLALILGVSFEVSSQSSVAKRLPEAKYVLFKQEKEAFALVNEAAAASIIVSDQDWKGVLRAAKDLVNDIGRVTGIVPLFKTDDSEANGAIIAGTIGQSPVIDRLISQKKLDVSEVKGQWESFIIQTIDGNVVIAGSDKRGTIYGIYDLSEQIGVSPWHYWADVPVKNHKQVFIKNGKYIQPSPKVKYRGIFINDEWPSFGGWATSKFGGINSKMYATMFELLLRLKANYLWPAMWSSAFNEDDPLNPVVADEYGIVMGTSHHEPMMRAHKEYSRRKQEVGAWDYSINKEGLDKFFREGIERNKKFDNLVTIGMRGDGDVAMSEGGDEANMKVLKNVVSGQRDIFKQVYGKDPSEIPQLWAIFTEVQRYYDAGFTVPEDVLLLFCDNNWGYIRRTAPEHEKRRKGGMGMYYHIDMNGGPWNDRWINTTTIPKLHEQFSLAYESGIDRLWVVNVGDLKPKELPIDFILRYAWDPQALTADKTWDYTVDWARKIFGDQYASDIATIVSRYAKYNLWRKPEVQIPEVFSVVNHREADSVLGLWKDIVQKAEALEKKLAPAAKDAYYQLVLYPVKASAGVAEIYISAGKNNLFAKQKRVSANDYANRAKELFELDEQMSNYYNNELSGGKWKNMMQDKHIGYTQWSMPKKNELPPLVMVEALKEPALGIAVEGSEKAWPENTPTLSLPKFDPLDNPTYYIDLFNRGTGEISFIAKADQPWIKLNTLTGKFDKEARVFVSIDWTKAPQGNEKGSIEILQGNQKVQITVPVFNAKIPVSSEPFFGSLTNAEFSIPAYAFTKNVATKSAKWGFLPDLGRGLGNMGIVPAVAPSTPAANGPSLEYKVYLPEKGKVTVAVGIVPTQDVNPARGLRLAIGLNNQKPVVLDARQGFVDTFKEYTKDNLQRSNVLKELPPTNKLALSSHGKRRRNEIFDNMRWLEVQLNVENPGFQILKLYMVDPEVVLENIVVNPDNNRPSYFGAPAKKHQTQ